MKCDSHLWGVGWVHVCIFMCLCLLCECIEDFWIYNNCFQWLPSETEIEKSSRKVVDSLKRKWITLARPPPAPPRGKENLAWWSPGSPASWPPRWSCPPGVGSPCGSEWCHPQASSWSPRGLDGNTHGEESTSRCSLSLALPSSLPLVSL